MKVEAYVTKEDFQRGVGAYMDFYIAAMQCPPADSETVELVRIRNAVAHACEY